MEKMSFTSINGNSFYTSNFIASLDEFSEADQKTLLEGGEVYDTLHNDGSYCCLDDDSEV